MTGGPTEPVSMRWPEAEIAPIRALAAHETEGNVSQMIRKLVREALAARQPAPKRAPRATQEAPS